MRLAASRKLFLCRVAASYANCNRVAVSRRPIPFDFIRGSHAAGTFCMRLAATRVQFCIRLVAATWVPFTYMRLVPLVDMHFLHALATSTVQSHQFQLNIFMKGK